MASKSLTKLKPAPVAYPNGGGLKNMANGNGKRQKLEREALAKQHEVELAKLAEKHANENKPKATVKKKSNG
jgi:hypothetical protein